MEKYPFHFAVRQIQLRNFFKIEATVMKYNLIAQKQFSKAFLTLALVCTASMLCTRISNADQRASLSWTEVSNSQISEEQIQDSELWVGKDQLQESIAFSLKYLRSERAKLDYQRLALPGITQERVLESVSRFSTLLETCSSYKELSQLISEEFILIKPLANSLKKSVKFTGYFQPTYFASKNKTDKYRYPIYALPDDFNSWPNPQPKRIFLEGYSGEGNKVSPLYGKELAYLASRWEAFMIHVQGSAILTLTDNTQMSVGFAGATNYPFRGISRSFLQQYKVAWTRLGSFFSRSPHLLNDILSRNNRFIFFKVNSDTAPIGSLGVPVIAERSIATDKSLMPPGALSVVSTLLPYLATNGEVELKPAMRFVLDQDTGSAIKGSARVDIFMGTGPDAQKKANAVFAKGDLYYLLIK